MDVKFKKKALQKASESGQKIYNITKDNIDQVLPFLKHNSDAINDISKGIAAGKEVTTHTDPVSIPGNWSGFGYIITDPVLGDGVYKISGGMNGSFTEASDVSTIVSMIGGTNSGSNRYDRIPSNGWNKLGVFGSWLNKCFSAK